MAQQGEGDRSVRIGPYRLVRALGDGTLGRAVLAEQDEPKRDVVIKLLRFSHGSEEDRLRFREEVERLSTLEYPGVARLFGAGQVGPGLSGTPYLVQEAVQGVPMLDYARSHGLPLQARLQLVAKLARIVHYAHTRGVLHRDLKPSKVLVTESGEPKVLDFGLSRLFGDDLSRYTQLGQSIGLLVYLSPEQCTGGTVDARSDVYALGVVAYELLCGALPLAPPAQGGVPAAIAQLRAAAPVRLADRLPEAGGDLDTVIMKALSAAPDERYGSAAEFAADIERYLAAHPIEARPPTPAYVVRLFVRRHPRLAAVAVGTVGSLLLGLAGAIAYAVHEHGLRRAAEQRASVLDAGNRLLGDVLAAADPASPPAQPLTVRQLLDRARLVQQGEHGIDAAARALAARPVATGYAQLGDHETALAVLDSAEQALRASGKPDPLRLAALRLSRAAIQVQRGDTERAMSTLAPLLAAPPSADPEARRVLIGAREVAVNASFIGGRIEEALQANAAQIKESQRLLGADDPATFAAELDAIVLLQRAGRLQDARNRGAGLLPRMRARLGALHPYTLSLMPVQALNLSESGDVAGAETLLHELVVARQQLDGPEHRYTLDAQRLYAQMLRHRDPASPEAESLLRQLADTENRVYGGMSADTQAALADLAHTLAERGRLQDAEALYRVLLAARRAQDDTAETLALMHRHAQLLLAGGSVDEALASYAELVPRARALLGEHEARTLAYMSDWAEGLHRAGRDAEARMLIETALVDVGSLPEAQQQLLHRRAVTIYEALGDAAAASAQRAIEPPTAAAP